MPLGSLKTVNCYCGQSKLTSVGICTKEENLECSPRLYRLYIEDVQSETCG